MLYTRVPFARVAGRKVRPATAAAVKLVGWNTDKGENSNRQQVDVSKLAPGNYILTVSGQDESVKRMFVKE